MAILHIESFDWYNDMYALQKDYYYAAAQGPGTGRRGAGQCAVMTSANERVHKYLGATYSTIITGFAYNRNGWVNQNGLLAFTDGPTSVQVCLATDNVGRINAYRGPDAGGTLLGSSDVLAIPALSTWVYIECKVVFSNTGSVQVKVNGVTVLDLSNVDTTNTANAYCDMVVLGYHAQWSNWAPGGSFDDWYILDTTGSAPNNDFLGDVRVDMFLPNADGTYSQWNGSDGNQVNNYALVDETQPSSTDYVSSTTTGNKDSYGFADISHTPTTVHAVKVTAWASHDLGGQKNVKILTRTNSTDYTSSAIATNSSYTGCRQLMETNPNTAVAWTKTNFNSAEFGVEVA